MSRRTCMIVIAVALGAGAGCDRGTPTAGATKASTSKVFTLKGVVKKVDVGSGEVTITHEEIAGFMPRMTMPFAVKNRASLEDVRPGDEVEGPLTVSFEGEEVKAMDLTGLSVTRAASSAPVITIEAPPLETLKPGDPVPDFVVTTQEGRTLQLSDLKGEVVILTFIYTRCPLPEFCPAMDTKFADLARRISASPARSGRVRLLSISFDPEHDSPEILAAHAARRGAKSPLWTFAVASHEELAKVAGPLGLSYVPGTRDIGHNLRTAVIGPDGKLARLEQGPGWSPVDLLETAYALIPPARR
jgi:protein SCO1